MPEWLLGSHPPDPTTPTFELFPLYIQTLPNMSLDLQKAHELYLHPHPDSSPILLDVLQELGPEDMGRFWALRKDAGNYDILGQYPQENDKTPGRLIVGVRRDDPACLIPDEERVDAFGTVLDIVRDHGSDFARFKGIATLIEEKDVVYMATRSRMTIHSKNLKPLTTAEKAAGAVLRDLRSLTNSYLTPFYGSDNLL